MDGTEIHGTKADLENASGGFDFTSDIARGRYYARPSKIKFWTPEEDEKIRDCVSRGLSFPEIAREVGRPKAATMGRVYRLGLTSGRPPTRSDYSTSQQRQGER
jgi:hypothetical protein